MCCKNKVIMKMNLIVSIILVLVIIENLLGQDQVLASTKHIHDGNSYMGGGCYQKNISTPCKICGSIFVKLVGDDLVCLGCGSVIKMGDNIPCSICGNTEINATIVNTYICPVCNKVYSGVKEGDNCFFNDGGKLTYWETHINYNCINCGNHIGNTDAPRCSECGSVTYKQLVYDCYICDVCHSISLTGSEGQACTRNDGGKLTYWETRNKTICTGCGKTVTYRLICGYK